MPPPSRGFSGQALESPEGPSLLCLVVDAVCQGGPPRGGVGGCYSEHLHVATAWGLGFFTTWQLWESCSSYLAALGSRGTCPGW